MAEPTKYAADVTVGLITELAKAVANQIGNAANTTKAAVESQLFNTHKKYVENLISRNSKIRTLIHRSSPEDFNKVYVESYLYKLSGSERGSTISGSKRTDTAFIKSINTKSKYIIKATAGAGKSILIKNILLSLAKSDRFIPIYVELRRLNRIATKSIETLIYSELKAIDSNLSFDHFKIALQNQKYILLLDGLDEVREEFIADIEVDIIDFSKKYDRIPIIITSRPTKEFIGWSNFEEHSIDKLSLEQIYKLADKSPYDSEKISIFKSRVKEELYDSHGEFLSTPLLASMMLITFDVFSDIPGKRHIFYSKAFDVLLDRHDSLKPGFKREFKTELEEDEFRELFSTFCFFSYMDESYGFSRTKALSIAKKSIEYCEFKIKPSDLLSDLEKCVCILVRDGEEYSFLHRSFQEYFTAVFISCLTDEHAKEIFEVLFDTRIFSGEFFALASEVDKQSFERNFMMPMLTDLCETLLNEPEESRAKLFQEMSFSVARPIGRWSDFEKETSLPIILGAHPTKKVPYFLFLQILLDTYLAKTKLDRKIYFGVFPEDEDNKIMGEKSHRLIDKLFDDILKKVMELNDSVQKSVSRRERKMSVITRKFKATSS